MTVPQGTTGTKARHPEFKSDTIFQVLLGVTTSELDDETVVADPLRHKYFRLNSTGSVLWRLARRGDQLSAIIVQFAQQFELDPKRAEEIVADFLGDLVDKGVLLSSSN